MQISPGIQESVLFLNINKYIIELKIFKKSLNTPKDTSP